MVASMLFSPQLKLVDSPLPMFSCFIAYSVFVSDSSPQLVAYADVAKIPVNAAAVKIAAIVNKVIIVRKFVLCDYI
jgi:hypothetical protein